MKTNLKTILMVVAILIIVMLVLKFAKDAVAKSTALRQQALAIEQAKVDLLNSQQSLAQQQQDSVWYQIGQFVNPFY